MNLLGFIGSVIGFAIAGPAGAAIGGALGGLAQNLISPKVTKVFGERLSNVKVNSYEYGKPIAYGYGTIVVGGSLIWAKDLEEVVVVKKKGNSFTGKTRTETYQYFFTGAYALCEGPAQGLSKIWINNEILEDAANPQQSSPPVKRGIGIFGFGIQKEIIANQPTASLYTFFTGSEDQMPSKTIVKTEGLANTPAFRGLCYVVIERIEVTKYGRNIPNFNFEVVLKLPDLTFSNEGGDDPLNLVNITPVFEVFPDTLVFNGKTNTFVAVGAEDSPFENTIIEVNLNDTLTYQYVPTLGITVPVANYANSSRIVATNANGFGVAFSPPISNLCPLTENYSILSVVQGTPGNPYIEGQYRLRKKFDDGSINAFEVYNGAFFKPKTDADPGYPNASNLAETLSVYSAHAVLVLPTSTYLATTSANAKGMLIVNMDTKALGEQYVYGEVFQEPGYLGEPYDEIVAVNTGAGLAGAFVGIAFDTFYQRVVIRVVQVYQKAKYERALHGAFVNNDKPLGETNGVRAEPYKFIPISGLPNTAIVCCVIGGDESFVFWHPNDQKLRKIGLLDGTLRWESAPMTFVNPTRFQGNHVGSTLKLIRFPSMTPDGLFQWYEVDLDSGGFELKNVKVENGSAFIEDVGNYSRFYYNEEGDYFLTSDGKYKISVNRNGDAGVLTGGGVDGGVRAIIRDICYKAGYTDEDIYIDENIEGAVYSYPITQISELKELFVPLQQMFFFDVIESDDKIKFIKRRQIGYDAVIDKDELVLEDSFLSETITQESELPYKVIYNYYDPSRDFRVLSHSSQRYIESNNATVDSGKILVAELNLGVSPLLAKRATETALYTAWIERSNYTFFLGPKYLDLDCGDNLQITTPEAVYQVRLTQNEVTTTYKIEMSAVSEQNTQYFSNTDADQGKFEVPITFNPFQPGYLYVLQLPYLSDINLGAYNTNVDTHNHLLVSAPQNTTGGSFYGVSYQAEIDNTGVYNAGDVRLTQYTGRVNNTLPLVDNPFIVDTTSVLNVDLGIIDELGPPTLSSVTDEEFYSSVNRAIIYDLREQQGEVICFKNAVLQPNGSYNLSTLLRGRNNTETFCGKIPKGSLFVVLKPGQIVNTSEFEYDAALKNVLYTHVTIGDYSLPPAETQIPIRFEFTDLRPASVSGIEVEWGSGDNIVINFQRGTRNPSYNNLLDGSGKNFLLEEIHRYEIELLDTNDQPIGLPFVYTPTSINQSMQATLTTAYLTSIGLTPSSLTNIKFRIYQMSNTVGRGFALTHTAYR